MGKTTLINCDVCTHEERAQPPPTRDGITPAAEQDPLPHGWSRFQIRDQDGTIRENLACTRCTSGMQAFMRKDEKDRQPAVMAGEIEELRKALKYRAEDVEAERALRVTAENQVSVLQADVSRLREVIGDRKRLAYSKRSELARLRAALAARDSQVKTLRKSLLRALDRKKRTRKDKKTKRRSR